MDIAQHILEKNKNNMYMYEYFMFSISQCGPTMQPQTAYSRPLDALFLSRPHRMGDLTESNLNFPPPKTDTCACMQSK